MGAFKPRAGLRSWEDPDLAWKIKGQEVRIFLLEPKESIQTKTSTNYYHRFGGPAVVTLRLDRGSNIFERHPSDPAFWSWIARLIAPTIVAYGGEVLTNFDRPIDLREEDLERLAKFLPATSERR